MPSIDKSCCWAYVVNDFKPGQIGNSFKKEKIMVEVTESATKQIAEYFKGKEVAPIRIFLNSGG